jgi:hypothetical protein
MGNTEDGVGVVSGTGLHEFQLVFYADLEGPCGPVPAKQVEATPAVARPGTVSRQGQQYILATVLHPPPGCGYSFPVVLTMQLSDSKTSGDGNGQDCPGHSSFRAGPVFGRFLHQRGFKTEQEALSYLNSAEGRQIKAVMTSLTVSVY